MELAQELAHHLVTVGYDDLGSEDIELAKVSIIDTLGTMIAGTVTEEANKLTELVEDWGGKEEATIAGRSQKVPCHNGALVNATMARVFDFNDVHDMAFLHPSPTSVPVAFATAQRMCGAGGRDFLCAVILGSDLTCRISLGNKIIPFVTGHAATYQCGTFGAAATAGRLLGLGEEQMLHALGIAYSQTSGSMQRYLDKAMTISVQQGLTSSAGLLSAILASKGVTGATRAMEGKYGYYNTFQRGEYERDAVTNALGRRFESSRVSIKPYPCCRRTHGALDATLNLVRRFDVQPENVKEVAVKLNESSFNVNCVPLEEKRRPASVNDALWSIPYLVATAIRKRDVFLDDLTEEAITDEATVALAQKVKPEVDPELERLRGREVTPAVVEIRTVDGNTYSEEVPIAKGDPDNRLPKDECLAKFRKCVDFAVRKKADMMHLRENSETIIQMVEQLESVKDATDIIRLCTP